MGTIPAHTDFSRDLQNSTGVFLVKIDGVSIQATITHLGDANYRVELDATQVTPPGGILSIVDGNGDLLFDAKIV